MRNLTSALAALSILVPETGFAQADGALAPGKPAGLSRAQGAEDNTVLYILGLGAIAAGIAILASSNNNNGTPTSGSTGGTSGGGTTTTTTT